MPAVMEDYSLIKQIGKGNYGKVWLIKKNHSNKQYVLKQIDMQNVSRQEQCSAYVEVKLLSSLKHPNIVSYYNSFQEENGILHIIMGYCENGDLYTYIRSRKGLLFPEKQIVEWFIQICMALQYLHERNILHRDLKTQNIFLTKTKIIKVGDLGIARILDSTCDLATTLIGTPYYMSPELFSNQPYNHKSDVWALGCCIYEMATLKHAFNARDLNSLMYKVLLGKLPIMPKQYSAELVELICLMLNYDASCRPTVKCILQNDYMRRHIMDFLMETNNRYKKSSFGHEKCSPPFKSAPICKNAEAVNVDEHSHVQTKLNRPTVSKVTEIPITQESKESSEIKYTDINDPASSRKYFLLPNKRFEEGKIENCSNDRSQFFIEKKVNEAFDKLGKDFSKNFATELDNSKTVRNKQINDRPFIIDENSLLHHNDELNSEKIKTTPPSRRRRRWRRARSEGDTATSSHNSCNAHSNRKNNISVRPLPPVPSQLTVHSLEDVNIMFCNGDGQRPDLQQDNSIEERNLSPSIHVVSKNSEARRRRREKLQQQQQLSGEHIVVSMPKSHESSVSKESPSCNQLCYGIKQEVESNEEKIDTEFQEFIGILDSTLQLKDKCNVKQCMTTEKVNECKNKMLETSEIGNRTCLIQRRDLLIKDCSLALGDKLLKGALDAIDYTISDADLQPRLLCLLGKEQLDAYGGKIIQLKMYEDALAAR